MSSTTIRLSEETKHRLDALKREGESYEEVIRRLTERDRWETFGMVSETDPDTARDGLDEIRAAANEQGRERIARLGGETGEDSDGTER